MKPHALKMQRTSPQASGNKNWRNQKRRIRRSETAVNQHASCVPTNHKTCGISATAQSGERAEQRLRTAYQQACERRLDCAGDCDKAERVGTATPPQRVEALLAQS